MSEIDKLIDNLIVAAQGFGSQSCDNAVQELISEIDNHTTNPILVMQNSVLINRQSELKTDNARLTAEVERLRKALEVIKQKASVICAGINIVSIADAALRGEE